MVVHISAFIVIGLHRSQPGFRAAKTISQKRPLHKKLQAVNVKLQPHPGTGVGEQAFLQTVRHKGRQQPVIQLQGRAVRERHRAQFRAAGCVEAEMDFFLPRHSESSLFRSTTVECGGSSCYLFFLTLGIDRNLYFIRTVQGKRVVTGSQRHRTE